MPIQSRGAAFAPPQKLAIGGRSRSYADPASLCGSGGWCYDLASCAGRAKGALGSTNPAKSKDGKALGVAAPYM